MQTPYGTVAELILGERYNLESAICGIHATYAYEHRHCCCHVVQSARGGHAVCPQVTTTALAKRIREVHPSGGRPRHACSTAG